MYMYTCCIYGKARCGGLQSISFSSISIYICMYGMYICVCMVNVHTSAAIHCHCLLLLLSKA